MGVCLSDLAMVAQMAGWPTPMAGTPAQNGNNAAGNNDSSRRTEELAGWLTPSANEDAAGTENGKMQAMLSHQALLTGSTANGTNAVTARHAGYRLNPLFSLWLMGYPAEWGYCGVRGTR